MNPFNLIAVDGPTPLGWMIAMENTFTTKAYAHDVGELFGEGFSYILRGGEWLPTERAGDVWG